MELTHTNDLLFDLTINCLLQTLTSCNITFFICHFNVQ